MTPLLRAYKFARVLVLLWAGALVWLQSGEIENLQHAQDFLVEEVSHATTTCLELVLQDRESRQIRPRAH
jgi:hypothetical protein